MARQPGGFANKDGAEFEENWAIHLSLQVLRGEATSYCWEMPGVEGAGVDFKVTFPDGTVEAHSCKQECGDSTRWTVSKLGQLGVLQAAKRQILDLGVQRFVFVSSIPSPDISGVCDRARMHAGDLTRFRASLSSAPHANLFIQLGEALDLAGDRSNDLELVELLARIYFETGIFSRNDRSVLLAAASLMAMEAGAVLVDALGTVAWETRGKTMHSDQIRSALGGKGQLLSVPALTTAESELRRLVSCFQSTIEPLLIEGQVFPREETAVLLSKLLDSESERAVLLHGSPGRGKSSVLFELIAALGSMSVPVLPIRLDQFPLGNSLKSFWRDSLGLPASPANCLAAVAGARIGVLILDQLDILRWSGADSSSAMRVCKELVASALSVPTLKVVLCARTFDVQEEPAIRNLTRLGSSSFNPAAALAEIEVLPFPEKFIEELCQAKGVTFQNLSSAEQDLLRVPQFLKLWLDSLKRSAQRSTSFNRVSLVHGHVAQARKDATLRPGVSERGITESLDHLLDRYERASIITISTSSISSRYSVTLAALASVGLLHDSGGSLRFAHQITRDFLLVERILEKLRRQCLSAFTWLTEGEQPLARRGPLGLLLDVMWDENDENYVDFVFQSLTSPQVRFHLKHVVYSHARALLDPGIRGAELVRRLSGNRADLAEFIRRSILGSTNWLRALSEQGVIQTWLTATDESTFQQALDLCRAVSSQAGVLIETILGPLWEEHPDLRDRLGSVLPFQPEADSDRLFEWRIELLRSGRLGDGQVDSAATHGLAKKRPDRLIQLTAAACRLALSSANDDLTRRALSNRSPLSESLEDSTTDLSRAAATFPKLAWEELVPVIQLAMDYKNSRPPMVFGTRDYYTDELLRQIVAAAAIAGRRLAKEGPEPFWEATSHLRAQTAPHLRALLMSSYSGLPGQLADVALSWLVGQPHPFGDPQEIMLPGIKTSARLLERLAPGASGEVLARVEEAILRFRPNSEVRSVEESRDAVRTLRQGARLGFDPFVWENGFPRNLLGLGQRILLEAVPSHRLSAKGKATFEALRSKFPSFADLMAEPKLRGGMVVSPIPSKQLRFVSDRDWISIASSPLARRRTRFEAISTGLDGNVLESSHEAFSSDFGEMAKRQPSRFARIALSLDPSKSGLYFHRLLWALGTTERPSDTSGGANGEVQWSPATVSEVEAVFAHLRDHHDKEIVRGLSWILQKRAREAWSGDTIDRLIRYALSHDDPHQEALPAAAPNDRSESVRNELEMTALNSARGGSLIALSQILGHHPDLLPAQRETLLTAAGDSNASVRVAAFSLPLVIAALDEEFATELLLQAASHPDDRVLGSRDLLRALARLSHRNISRLEPLIERMSRCGIGSARTFAAELAVVLEAKIGALHEVVGRALAGDDACRIGLGRGYAYAVSSSLGDQDLALDRLVTLVGDPSRQVVSAAVSVFQNEEFLESKAAVEVAVALGRSKWFVELSSRILEPLSQYAGDLTRFAQFAELAALRFAESRRIGASLGERGMLWNEELGTFLLRIYEQASARRDKTLRELCLNAWDLALESSIHGVEGQLSRIES
jgi:hypothetical protein